MKRKRMLFFIGIGTIFLFCVCGCVYPSGLFGVAQSGMGGLRLLNRFKSNKHDTKEDINISLESAKRASENAMENMGLVIDTGEKESKGNFVIKGHSLKHKISIVLAPLSGKITRVTVSAKQGMSKDEDFESIILGKIEDECEKYSKGAVVSASSKVDAVSGATIKISNIREGPGVNYKIVAVAPKGAKLIFLDNSGNWLKVKVLETGRIGYIYNTLARPNGI